MLDILVRQKQLNFAPGAHYLYSNSNTYFDSGNLDAGGRLSFPNPQAWQAATIHIALQADATNNQMRWYANGVLFAQVNSFSTFTGEASFDLLIGDGAGKLQGTMSEFRIWNYLRTPGQLQEGMQVSFGTPRVGLLACWRLGEAGGTDAYASAGTQVLDRSGNNYHGIIY